jgi:hypothetical protein
VIEDYQVTVEGSLGGLKVAVEDLPDDIRRAASRSINATLRRGRTRAGELIRQQLNYPARYLVGQNGRIKISKFASEDKLEGVITGRNRPTSLARFSRTKRIRKGPVRVQVKPGVTGIFERGFLIPLRSGNSDTLGNLGLALRTSGGRPKGTSRGKEIAKNLWLLYGPSVAQALLNVSGSGIYKDMEKELLDYMENEFNRQIDLELA